MITPAQAGMLLAMAAEIDGRQVTSSMASMWAAALSHGDVAYPDLEAAVPLHFAESGEYLRPKHLIDIATRLGRERRHREHQTAQLAKHDPGPAAREIRERAEGTIRDRSADLAALLESFRVRPDGTERWSLGGDVSMRNRQGFPLSPQRQDALERAARLKAQELVAESRTGDHGRRPEPPGIEQALADAARLRAKGSHTETDTAT